LFPLHASLAYFMNLILLFLTIISAFNLILLALYVWIVRKNEKPFFWLGCMNIAIAVTIIDNLLIYYHSTHILLYHFTFIINISWGAYFINLLNALKNNKPDYRKQWLLFSPSILYAVFTVYSFIIPGYNNSLLQSIYENNPLWVNIISNFVILIYSLGANLYMLTTEIYQRKTEANDIFRKRRIEILVSFLSFQFITFLPYIITQSIIYLIFLMPVVSFLTYLWIFFRLQHILNVKEILTPNKYKNIKISHLEKKDLADKIEKHLRDNKPYLEPKYSLFDLSEDLDIQSHTISMVINSTLGLSFNELINKYRFEEAMSILNSSTHPKIESLAYDCGFGNRTSFYEIFKKYTGTTPVNYLKKVK